MSGVYRLLIACPDRVGLVSAVSSFIAEQGGNITEAHHFLDTENAFFFMRTEIESASLNLSKNEFLQMFRQFAAKNNFWFTLTHSSELKKY